MRIILFLLLLTSYSYSETLNLNTGSIQDWTKSGGVTNTTNGVIFNYQGGTVTKTFSNIGLSSNDAKLGFNSTFGTEIKFTCSNNIGGYCENPNGTKDQVTLTQTFTDNLGTSITQNKTILGEYNPNAVVYNDVIGISANSNISSYSLSLSIYAIDKGFWAGYYGPIVDKPTLSISYTPVISSTTTSNLDKTLNSVKIGDDGKIIPYTNSLTGQVYGNTLLDVYKSETSIINSPTDIKTENKIETKQEIKQEVKQEIKQEVKQDSSDKKEEPKKEISENKQSTEKSENKNEIKQDTTKENKQPENKKEINNTVVSNKDNKQEIKVSINKIDSLKLDTQQTLSNMIDNKMIDAYSVPFYKQNNIYTNQLPIADNKIIYPGVSLRAYLVKDMLAKKATQLAEIKEEKIKLLLEIEDLKNARQN